MVLFIGYLAAVVLAFAYLAPSVISGILADVCENCFGALFIINPFSDNLFQGILLRGQSFLNWFYSLTVLLAALFLYFVVFHGKSTVVAFKLPRIRLPEKLRSASALVVTGQVFLALLFFDLAYFALILPAIGIVPETPSFIQELPSWYLTFSLVEAAFVEEVAIRVTFIGLPLALGSMAIRVVQAASRKWGEAPRGARYVVSSLKHLVGGQVNGHSTTAAKVTAGLLVLLSAAFFGYLHVLTWGVAWKFVDTFVGGLALGYLFVRKGLAAAVLLHFSVNASSLLALVADDGTLTSLLLLSLFYLLLGALGAGFFAFYIREMGKRISRRGPKPSVAVGRTAPSSKSTPASGDDVLFMVRCPNCGSTEAVYEDGALRCASCGNRL